MTLELSGSVCGRLAAGRNLQARVFKTYINAGKLPDQFTLMLHLRFMW